MLISNSSQYDTQELARLVRYAFRGIPARGVGVNIIDLKPKHGRIGPASAVARDGVGERSPFYRVPGITRTVILRLGPPSAYPTTNQSTSRTLSRVILSIRFDKPS